MRWSVVAPFFTPAAVTPKQRRWLDDFVVSDRHSFDKVDLHDMRSGDWHARAGQPITREEWRSYWETAGRALHRNDGVLTLYPPLAATTGLRRRLGRSRKPVVAWCYNVDLRTGLRHAAARFAMADVERVVVHSRGEVEAIERWLELPPGRVAYVPLGCGAIEHLADEDDREPFVVAMGSAHRDYATFFEACRRTKLPAVVIASAHSVAGLSVPDNVEVRNGLTSLECRRIAQQARISVVPIRDRLTASGQIAVVEALRMGRPVIATRSVGTVDYIDHGATGLLVEPGDPAALASEMERLWGDAGERNRLAEGAARYAEAELSDVALAAQLSRILDEAASEHDRRS